MHRTATQHLVLYAGAWPQPPPPPVYGLAMYALPANEWDAIPYATRTELMIAQRAYLLWEAGEPGTDNDRWALAERIQRNDIFYDKVFAAVAAVLATALPPRARINRQTLVTDEVLGQATKRGINAIFPGLAMSKVSVQIVIRDRTLGGLVDVIVSIVPLLLALSDNSRQAS